MDTKHLHKMHSNWIQKQITIIHHDHINKVKGRNHIFILIAAEKAFENIQPAFMMNVLEALVIDGMCLKIIKTIYDKLIANIILNGEKLRAFYLTSGMGQGCPFPAILFDNTWSLGSNN